MRNQNTALFDRLFESLPVLEPVRRPMGPLPTSFFPMLQWKLNLPYIGFTPVERRREHQLQVWFQKGGMLPKPVKCSICQSTHSVTYHAEDYYNVWALIQICKSCHYKLHIRGNVSRPWAELVEQYRTGPDDWFALTPRDPKGDFAGYLRWRFGERHDLVHRSVDHFPDWVRRQLPEVGLMPLDFGRAPVNPVAKSPIVAVRPRPPRKPVQLDMFPETRK